MSDMKVFDEMRLEARFDRLDRFEAHRLSQYDMCLEGA